jgi:hypothetical protein
MGVDYYTCENCSHNYPDCGYYFRCSGCESGFCSNECGGRQVIEEESNDEVDDDSYHEEVTSCIFCRHEQYTTDMLLDAVIKHFNITREIAINIWRAEKRHVGK